MQLVPARQMSFEVTFDSASLNVGLTVWDTSTGTPALVAGPTAMVHLVNNTYIGKFTPTAGKQYVIIKSVYTDNTLATVDNTYSQGSESILCDLAPDTSAFEIPRGVNLPAFTFPMTDSTTHLPKTGLTGVVAKITMDGAALSTLAASVVEIGEGLYKVDIAGTELNGKFGALKFSKTGADTQFFSFTTVEN